MSNRLMTSLELRKWWHTTDWCPCGNPQEAFNYLRDILQLFEDTTGTSEKWDLRGQKFAEFGLPQGSRVYWFTLYVLDAMDLTEHGGSVNGSWLSSLGISVLAALRAHGTEPDEWEDDEENA